MNDGMHVLDTNVILGFASNFESHHDECKLYFETEYKKTTCSRVNNELGAIRSRRRKLYEDIKKYLTRNPSIEDYQPSIDLKENDSRHLKNLLPELKKAPPYDILRYIDRKTREIQAGIKKAKEYLVKPFIRPYHFTGLETHLTKWINNISDCQILSDSVCWAEENSPIIFCSNDFTDFIKKKEGIIYCICGFRGYEYRDRPLDICSVREIISN